MSGISIPGVSDKYKTNDLVKSLVEVEKLPLKREQEKLEGFKTEQANWRRVNQYMSSLRESTRSLYSFNNPFNEIIA
jgi:flagellar hook-associated protein 2